MAADNATSNDHESGDDESIGGKLRQLLHAATGDRDAEAKALADRAGDDVSEADALIAVERAHGERRDAETEGGEVATVKDARIAAGVEDADSI
jgi:hypothetical protein